jgi:uncharacterized membrane protein YphA (DoxX/SURF4 family)
VAVSYFAAHSARKRTSNERRSTARPSQHSSWFQEPKPFHHSVSQIYRADTKSLSGSQTPLSSLRLFSQSKQTKSKQGKDAPFALVPTILFLSKSTRSQRSDGLIISHRQIHKRIVLLNVALWISQVLLAIVFFYSGAMKSTKTEKELVAMGQTGVENLSGSLIRFIGVSEILGAVGMILPWLTGIVPILTPVAATSLGMIMILAAIVHFRRNEKTTAMQNLLILLVCAFVAYGRFTSPA